MRIHNVEKLTKSDDASTFSGKNRFAI